MTDIENRQHRQILKSIAHRAMIERGLIPDFPVQVLAHLDTIQKPATLAEGSVRDLRNLLWCSIDNDDSLDLDQLTVAEAYPNRSAKILIAINFKSGGGGTRPFADMADNTLFFKGTL